MPRHLEPLLLLSITPRHDAPGLAGPYRGVNPLVTSPGGIHRIAVSGWWGLTEGARVGSIVRPGGPTDCSPGRVCEAGVRDGASNERPGGPAAASGAGSGGPP